MIFAERQLLDKPIEKIATRNMFCKVWQEECVKAEIEATKDSQYYEEVVRVSTNMSR